MAPETRPLGGTGLPGRVSSKNRAIDGLTWVISWQELVDQGLPCPGIHRILLPIHEPSDLAEQQWRQALIRERGAIPRRF